MKEGWEYRLFESCLVKVPKQIQIKSKDYKSTGRFPIVSQEAELISGYWDDESIVYKHKEPIIIFGDHTKNIKYIDFDFVVGADGTHILSTKNDIIPKYFYYALKSIKLRELGYARHYKLLKEKFIPIPPLSEQQSIVAYLDSAFAKIDAMKANAEKALNEAKALFQASLKEMLEPKEGWITSTLKDECYKITDGTHQTPKYYPSGYIFLSSKNVTSRKIDWENVKYIDESQHQIMHQRVAPKVGDILLAKNGTTGVAAMVDRDIIFDIYVSLALLRSKGNVTPEYLLTFVNSPIAKEQFNKRLIGMGVPNLHLGEINQVVITYPKDKKEQAKMIQKIDEIDNLIIRLQANFEKISQECDALKQAILRQVFE
jgi:type I restriction enzyme S subunit